MRRSPLFAGVWRAAAPEKLSKSYLLLLLGRYTHDARLERNNPRSSPGIPSPPPQGLQPGEVSLAFGVARSKNPSRLGLRPFELRFATRV